MWKLISIFWIGILGVCFAELRFAESIVEIHAPADAKVVRAEFSFSNVGKKAVRIREYDSGCSCMGLQIKDGKMLYQAGESGLLRADFDLGKYTGTVEKVIAVWTDEHEDASVHLTVRVHIPQMIEMSPKTLQWDLNGEASAKTIRITMHDSMPTRVTAVNCSSPAFAAELRTIDAGKVYEIDVTPLRIDTPGLAVLRIETDSTMEKYQTQQAFAVVRKTVPDP
ncbi:MAG: DUF1573 domain-containing protein [Luteolibacter sp.]